MTNLFDYLKWRGDLTFSQDPVNSVDALIFSTLTYLNYRGSLETDFYTPVLLYDAAADFFSQPIDEKRLRDKNDLRLLREAAATARFGHTAICMYRTQFVPEQETQFAAMAFLLDDGSAFLGFRGTDYSLVGWKEDFNMSFQQVVPSQILAVDYVRDAAAELPRPLRLGGHSKGGNLAVFAAARTSPMIRERILEVYNNDGPGFTGYLMGDPGYLAMVPKIRTFVPQSSVIGMLLEHEEPYTVIRSKSVGLMQHDPYSWEVLGNHFIPVQEITQSSQFLDTAIKTWFAERTNQERSELVDVMFGLLGSGGVDRALDIFQLKNIRKYIKTISSDEHLRRILSTEFQSFLEAVKKTRAGFEESRPALTAGSEEGTDQIPEET